MENKVKYEVNPSNESLLNKIKQLEATNKHLIEINDAQSIKIKQLEEDKPINHNSILIERIFKMNDERFEKIKELELEIKQLKQGISSKRKYKVIGGEVTEGDEIVLLDFTNFPRVTIEQTKFNPQFLLNTDYTIATDKESLINHLEELAESANPVIKNEFYKLINKYKSLRN